MSNLKGKTIVNFGDSIFGNTQDETSVSAAIMNKTQATVYNLGLADAGWVPMALNGMHSACMPWLMLLSHMILPNKMKRSSLALEFHRRILYNTVALMKTLDFRLVDMVTIAYGTNDYTAGILDNELDAFDVKTFMGALRYSLKTIDDSIPAPQDSRAVTDLSVLD